MEAYRPIKCPGVIRNIIDLHANYLTEVANLHEKIAEWLVIAIKLPAVILFLCN